MHFELVYAGSISNAFREEDRKRHREKEKWST